MTTPKRGFLHLACLSALFHAGKAEYENSERCNLAGLPTVLLARDDETGNFSLVASDDDDSHQSATDGQTRYLLASHWRHAGGLRGSTIHGLELSNQELFDMVETTRKLVDSMGVDEIHQDWKPDGETRVFALACTCLEPDFPAVYCPAGTTSCHAPSSTSSTQLPTCVQQATSPFSPPLVLSLIIWYSILLACLVFSGFGQEVFEFLTGWCFPARNTTIAENMMERQPTRARHLLGAYYRRRYGSAHPQEDFQEDDANAANVDMVAGQKGKPPTSLKLRTKIFRANGTTKKEIQDTTQTESGGGEPTKRLSFSFQSEVSSCGHHEEEQCCAICFVGIADGECIGDLPCLHTYHVDCLKGWLTRRNVCPLCQQADIATPCYGPVSDSRGTEHRYGPSEHEADTTL